ncbi:MAG: DEAD/DEAH box helicase family protein [Rickettsiales bacterium]|jgi:type III restriction enzyme|nr:DEAD/DEAH box helicase family protein [Rickettsiales bacterium]
MKLRFKRQQFQIDAVEAVCDIFTGQTASGLRRYISDPGADSKLKGTDYDYGFANESFSLSKVDMWNAINKKQIALGLKPSDETDDINLTIEMETGTGKTYTYIKTMYELNKRYGWSKFIIVVPSIAIREGVKKSFEITMEHFKQEYGKSIIEFIYNSNNLTDIDRFALDNKIRVMIINSQAFSVSMKENGRGKESRIIFTKRDEFKGRCPIDVIAKTNPILILDEPQSLGKTADSATQKSLKLFNALFTLQYSATPPELNKNIIYRLDAQDAYNKKLVKKISVKGISIIGDSATEGYVYLSGLNLSVGKNPTATLEFDMRSANCICKATRICREGDNLYEISKQLDEYKEGWMITAVDGRTNSVRFQNGREIFAGEVIGAANEEQLRRIQIRETIASHFEREQFLFERKIKVLSLFFIDKVEKYRLSDDGTSANGVYAKIFEEEYQNALNNERERLNFTPEYRAFLEKTSAETAHKGYFSIDKKSGKFKDSEIKRGALSSDDIDAYDLIMKNKERLLDRNEPTRFIFSHSALREGWDNPNVFQICALKQSSNDTSRRQEIGRGLRLSVNQNGERMDENILGAEVQNINILTVIASESYEKFVAGLQSDIFATMKERPLEVSPDLFYERIVNNNPITREQSQRIFERLIKDEYVEEGKLTEKYHADVKSGTFKSIEGIEAKDIVGLLASIYTIEVENALNKTVELKINENKFSCKEFLALWEKINIKSAYMVDFNTDELIKESVNALDSRLHVAPLVVVIGTGTMDKIKSKQVLGNGTAFSATTERRETIDIGKTAGVKYDLIDKLVQGTNLTRATLTNILIKIKDSTFEKFSQNPEEFIIRATNIINEQKARAIIKNIKYKSLGSTYSKNIFTESTTKHALESSVETPKKHIYSHVVIDSMSTIERNFALALDGAEDVIVYAKLPSGFYIPTPVGKYNPDWAIVFNKKEIKYIYFVAETKGSASLLNLREIENAKITCARKHFEAISSNSVKYDIVTNYNSLLEIINSEE